MIKAQTGEILFEARNAKNVFLSFYRSASIVIVQ